MKEEPNLPRFGRDQPFPETSLGAYFPPGARRPAEDKPAPLPPSAALTAFIAALDRLEETIDKETELLEKHQPFDVEEINGRKSRSLLELSRLARALPAISRETLIQRADRLQTKLARNQAVLQLNLDAVREIADLLLGALGEAESDGTYGAPFERRDVA